jgi:hypothetical protein
MVAALAGCASTPAFQYDISRMQPDCANARLQINWLEYQIKNSGLDPTRSEPERKFISQAKELVWTIRSTCVVQ